jgi:hypothetical protein
VRRISEAQAATCAGSMLLEEQSPLRSARRRQPLETSTDIGS